MSVKGSGEIVTSHTPPPGSWPLFAFGSKCYRIGIAVLFGSGGVALLVKYWEAKTIGAMAAVGLGGAFVGLSVLFGTYEFFKSGKSGSITGQTGNSLLGNARPDAKTISGACKVLCITEDQISNKILIESQKTKFLEEHNKSLNRVLKNCTPSPESTSESPLIASLRLMIQDVETAYITLSQHSNPKNN